jgi:hypothetical protein
MVELGYNGKGYYSTFFLPQHFISHGVLWHDLSGLCPHRQGCRTDVSYQENSVALCYWVILRITVRCCDEQLQTFVMDLIFDMYTE